MTTKKEKLKDKSNWNLFIPETEIEKMEIGQVPPLELLEKNWRNMEGEEQENCLRKCLILLISSTLCWKTFVSEGLVFLEPQYKKYWTVEVLDSLKSDLKKGVMVFKEEKMSPSIFLSPDGSGPPLPLSPPLHWGGPPFQ